MAEVLEALFTAKETISDALDNISRAAEIADESAGSLQTELQELGGAGEITREAFEDLRQAVQETDFANDRLEDSITKVNLAMQRYENEVTQGEQASNEIRNALHEVMGAARGTEEQIDGLETELDRLAEAGLITDRAVSEIRSSLTEMGAVANLTNDEIMNIAQTMTGAKISTRQFDQAIEELTSDSALMSQAVRIAGNESAKAGAKMEVAEQGAEGASEAVDDLRNSSLGAAGALATMNSVITDSILNFGSLSVNIGPFNIALRNFITQVPAILTGMGSMVSLITALIAGFGTLAVVSGALVAGGALAFFEEFSGNFEESTEAIQAMGAALKNLFVDALSPLMTDANADLFVDVVNGMAEAVNRFAQFAQQMRDEVLGVFEQIDGDIDDFYNALRNAFILLEPVLVGFINFFLQDFPAILERFAILSKNLSGNIDILLHSFGGLLNQLLDLSATILAGVAPAVRMLVGLLSALAAIVNLLPKGLVSAAITTFILSVAVLKLIGALAGLGASLITVNGMLLSNAASGGLLGSVYGSLIVAAQSYTMTSMSLSAVLSQLTTIIWGQVVGFLASAKAKLFDNLVTKVLTEAYIGFMTVVKSTLLWMKLQVLWTYALAAAKWALNKAVLVIIGAFLGEAVASTIAASGTSAYATAASAAATATWALVSGILAIPTVILAAVALIAVLIGAIIEMMGIFSFTDAIDDFFGGLINWIDETIKKIAKLLGLSGNRPNMPGVADPDSISTNPNVNLSFKDELNQQVDVQADPEDKEGLRRIVKDAMNEANSIARRQEGVGR